MPRELVLRTASCSGVEHGFTALAI